MKIKSKIITALFAVSFGYNTAQAASIQFTDWTLQTAGSPSAVGNYALTISTTASADVFNFNLTVNPLNADALGLFIDIGSFNFGTTPELSNINTVPTGGDIKLFASDTTSDDCGNGCNLNGGGASGSAIDPVSGFLGDGQWELVVRLDTNGSAHVYQTFSFDVSHLTGVNLSQFNLAAIRAQTVCTVSGATIPCSSTTSEKAQSLPGEIVDPEGGQVPEPTVIALLGIGLLGFGISRKGKLS